MKYKDMSLKQKKIHQARVSLKGLEKKEKLVEMFGGKCKKCGYSKCLRAIEFHHINPELKSFQLTVVNIKDKKWEEIINEASKCELLCCRCHAEEEDSLAKQRFINGCEGVVDIDVRASKWSDVLRSVGASTLHKRHIKIKVCKKCNLEFKTKSDLIFCSLKCSSASQQKVERPSPERLKEMLQEMSWVKIGQEFGVSDNAVRKWAKSYGLI